MVNAALHEPNIDEMLHLLERFPPHYDVIQLMLLTNSFEVFTKGQEDTIDHRL